MPLCKNKKILHRKGAENMEEKEIKKLLLEIIEKIEKRDDLLIELTREIAQLKLKIDERYKM